MRTNSNAEKQAAGRERHESVVKEFRAEIARLRAAAARLKWPTVAEVSKRKRR